MYLLCLTQFLIRFRTFGFEISESHVFDSLEPTTLMDWFAKTLKNLVTAFSNTEDTNYSSGLAAGDVEIDTVQHPLLAKGLVQLPQADLHFCRSHCGLGHWLKNSSVTM